MHNLKELLNSKVDDRTIHNLLIWGGIQNPTPEIIRDFKNLNFVSLSQHIKQHPITKKNNRGPALTALGVPSVVQFMINSKDLEDVVDCLLENGSPEHLKRHCSSASDLITTMPSEIQKALYPSQGFTQELQEQLLINVRLTVLLSDKDLFDHYLDSWKNSDPSNTDKGAQEYFNEVLNQPPLQRHIEGLADITLTEADSVNRKPLLEHFCETHNITMDPAAIKRTQLIAEINKQRDSAMQRLLINQPEGKLATLWHIICDWIINLWNDLTGKTSKNREDFLKVLDNIQHSAEHDLYLDQPQLDAIISKITDIKKRIKKGDLGEKYTDKDTVGAEILSLQRVMTKSSQENLANIFEQLITEHSQLLESLPEDKRNLVNQQIAIFRELKVVEDIESALIKGYDVEEHLQKTKLTTKKPEPIHQIESLFKVKINSLAQQAKELQSNGESADVIKEVVLDDLKSLPIPRRYKKIHQDLIKFIENDPVDHQDRDLMLQALTPSKLIESHDLEEKIITLRALTLEPSVAKKEHRLKTSLLAMKENGTDKHKHRARAYLNQLLDDIKIFKQGDSSLQQIIPNSLFSPFGKSQSQSTLEDKLSDITQTPYLPVAVKHLLLNLVRPSTTNEHFSESLNALQSEAELYEFTQGAEGIDPQLYYKSVEIAQALWLDNKSVWEQGQQLLCFGSSKNSLIKDHTTKDR
jgi:hypothetical protein